MHQVLRKFGQNWCRNLWYDSTSLQECAEMRTSRSKLKIILIIFFYYYGIIHYEFVSHTNVNAKLCQVVLRKKRQKIKLLIPDFWKTNKWFIYHDNARPHFALISQTFLIRHFHPTIPHPSYSPDSAPTDYFMFYIIENCFK